MALPFAYAAAQRGQLAATRGCGPVSALYYFSPNHTDDATCLRAYDESAMWQLGWAHHLIPIPAQWQPPPLRDAGARLPLALPPGAPAVRRWVLLNNKYNTEWAGPPVNFLSRGLLGRVLAVLEHRGFGVIYSRPTAFADNSLVLDLGEAAELRGGRGSLLLVDDVAAANPGLSLNDVQVRLFSRAQHAVTVQGGPAALAGYFVPAGGRVLVLHKQGEEWPHSREYQAVYSHLNGAHYEVAETDDDLLALVQTL